MKSLFTGLLLLQCITSSTCNADVLDELKELRSAGVPAIRKKIQSIWANDWKAFQDTESAESKLIIIWKNERIQENWQTRAAVVWLAGYCASADRSALNFMRKYGAKDTDWRVQECLAKGFDDYGRLIGYGNIIDDIKDWLGDSEPNVRRAVTEGLRPWVRRSPFDKDPSLALSLLLPLQDDPSPYVKKSCINAIRDIATRIPDLETAKTLGKREGSNPDDFENKPKTKRPQLKLK